MSLASRWNRQPLAVRIYWCAAAAVVAILGGAAARLLHWGSVLDATFAVNATDAPPCEPQRSGESGRTASRTAAGIAFEVVTPRNYRAARAYPLLVVYAPAGLSPGLSERFAGITHAATASGFIVAFAESVTMSLAGVARLAEVPDAVAARWCVDPHRIYATGHSDGGTVATALAILPATRGRLTAIAVSGAGWRADDFAAHECPPPIPVMIAHGAADTHFPEYGRDAARWWWSCNRCEDALPDRVGGCVTGRSCAAATTYCESDRSHWRWAADPAGVVGFLAAQSGAPATGDSP